MSSFHPLAADSHPLTSSPELPFHHDEEDAWTPPSLPGETRILPSKSRSAGSGDRTRTRGGGGNGTPSDLNLDPLLHSGLPSSARENPDGANAAAGSSSSRGVDDDVTLSGAHGQASLREFRQAPTPTWGSGGSIGNGSGGGREAGVAGRREERRVGAPAGGALGRAGGDGSSSGGGGAVLAGRPAIGGESRTLSSVHTLRQHSYYAPTFCDACSQLLIGIMHQGLQCEVCKMNLHPECRATPCSLDHRCRPPEAIHISAGVDASRVEGMHLRPGNPWKARGGGGGMGAPLGGSNGIGAPFEDPLDSEWHKKLVHNKQLWVPDSVVAGCMVCSRTFNVVFRRHHCRRCGTCMCGSCSHTAVSDKVLSVNQATGDVIRLSSGEPVRCCTPCTRVLDQQLALALQRKGWGARKGTPAADVAARRMPPGATSRTVGGGYAASLPASSSVIESADGGGFVPPPSASRTPASHGDGNGGAARSDGFSGGGFGGGGFGAGEHLNGDGGGFVSDGHGHDEGGNGYGFGPGNGMEDPLSGGVNEQQRPIPSPTRDLPPPPQHEEPPVAAGVPSWLGQSSLGSRRATKSSGASRAEAAGKRRETDEAAGAWGEGGADGEEATDWSASGSVV